MLAIGVKNLNGTVDKMNNTKPLVIGIKPKDPFKPGIVKLDKYEKYPEENVLPEVGCTRYLYQLSEQHRDKKKKNGLLTLSEVKIQTDYYLQDGPGRAFMWKEFMHVSEDTQAPLAWVSNGSNHT